MSQDVPAARATGLRRLRRAFFWGPGYGRNPTGRAGGKWRWAISAVLACLALAAGLLPSRTEPRYKGLSLSKWLDLYQHTYDERHYEAGEAVRRLGPKALPSLVRWTDCEVPPWRLNLSAWLNKAPRCVRGIAAVAGLVEAKHDARCELAFSGFELLGPEAAPALPDLTRLMERSRSLHVQRHVLWAFAHLGPSGLSPLVASFENPNSDHELAGRLIAAGRYFAPNGASAVPVLARYATNADYRVARAAIRALGSVGSDSRITVSALTNCLERCMQTGRGHIAAEEAAYALARLGTGGQAGVPSLLRALHHRDLRLRSIAYGALSQLAPDSLQGFDEQSLGLIELP